MLFCWGSGSYGQLGLGKKRASQLVPLRRAPPVVGGQEVARVACGERHTLLLLADGSLASCGDNAQGQLGSRLPPGQRRRYVPEQIQALEVQTIIYISCGKEHSLAVCNQGRVFSWGAGGFGQLGTGKLEDVFIPKKINSLSMYSVIQVACGHYHSIALTKDGRVFSWGQNVHGQLGLGKEFSSQANPCNISSLAGIPLAQVAAGGAHSFVLSHSGIVYGWGRNNAHQLGLSQKTAKEQVFKPYSIGALRNLEVTYVSCGDEHTAVLTKSGSVFTFGDDSAGQLGRNSSTPKTGPQKVDEIDGPVSHVSCGSYHTLCVSASGQLWSFGYGLLQHRESPGLDSRQEERKCIDLSALLECNVLLGAQVFAGTYVNFVNIFQASACRNAAASLEVLPRISQLDRALIEKWKSAEVGSETQKNAKREIEAIFSSPPCLTASFLKPRSGVSMDCYIPVDMQEAREVLKELTVRDWIASQRLPTSLAPQHPLEALTSLPVLPSTHPFPLPNCSQHPPACPQHPTPTLLIWHSSHLTACEMLGKDFVDKYVDYIFNKSVEEVFREFKRGFYKVLDEQLVDIFEPEQLMEVAIGNASYDWHLYEENAAYGGIYSPTHPTIKMFWEVFHELSLEDKKGFLSFVVGGDRISVTEKSWKITIHPHDLPSDDLIPEAQTCFHLLQLPTYSTKQKLKEKLLWAIKNNRGFGKCWRIV
ncbi:putative E3 ubiquitin-protein ligase HERC6 [Liasis olivaceus]